MSKTSRAMKCVVMLAAIFLFLSAGCSNKTNTVNTNNVQRAAAGTLSQTTPGPKPAEPTPAPTVSPAPSATPQPTPTPVPSDKPKVKKSLPILYYHAINDHIEGIEELFVSPKEFEKQMEYLKKNNYTVITFDQLKDVQNIENPVIITLDDGYEDNYTYAYPILKKYGFKATIFVTTDFIDKSFYLSTAQIKEMSGLVNFQGHSITHPYLTRLKSEEVEHELSESKKIIEGITGKKVDVFAYPIGDYDKRVLDITKKHYRYAVLNGGGLYTEGDSDYEMKRVYVPRQLDIEGFAKKIKGGR